MRTDRHWLYLASALRAVGLSMLAILVGAHLLALGLGPFEIGAVGAAGL
ncbi:MAG: hypothetical protein HZB39_15500 [Planctomycetes bacterium]|nr:hypothetical protein [Planctomycetota bacterium]